jgi:RNA polymerase sigma-70 factor (ECF subfamily)
VGRLVDIFTAAGGARPENVEELGIEALLGELCARGRTAHPTFAIDDEVFVAHLARCGAPVADGAGAIHAEDLYLVCACLRPNDAAIARLRAIGRPVMRRHLSSLRESRATFEEIEQRLWDAVLVGTPPRLAGYAGRGALGAWIGVTARRIALMDRRHERSERRARREVAAQDRLVAENPELAVIKHRYRAEFQRAIASALETLDDRQRMLYRMHLVDGLTLESIAKAYRVHGSTVGRWLEAARQQVLEEAKRQLKAELPSGSDDFDSLARLLASGLDISISQALKLR